MTTTKPETNMQRFARESREGQERLRVERDADPQQRAMAKAHTSTRHELDAIGDAEKRLQEAEKAVGAAGIALRRAEEGMRPIRTRNRRGEWFETSAASYKAAAASLPGLRADVAEARERANGARRRLNTTVAEVNAARMERRRAAKVAHAPKVEPITSRNSGWGSMAAMQRWEGKPEGKS